MPFSAENPFSGSVPPSVHLPNTPLTGVVVQVSFPEQLSLSEPDCIGEFQRAIQTNYPHAESRQDTVLRIGPEGIERVTRPKWVFSDPSKQWRLSLTNSFIALNTKRYTSRTDLVQRIAFVSETIDEIVKPGFVTRIGVRYADRLRDSLLSDIGSYVRPELLWPSSSEPWKGVRHTYSELTTDIPVGQLTMRWGFSPKTRRMIPSYCRRLTRVRGFSTATRTDTSIRRCLSRLGLSTSALQHLPRGRMACSAGPVSQDFLRKCGGEP